jgi:hypothetical protein
MIPIPHFFSGDFDEETPQQVLDILTKLNCAPIGGPADILPVWGFLDDDDYNASAYFVMFSQSNFAFYEISGSHCSCHGFEYQFVPNEVTFEYLQMQRNWPNMEETILSVIAYSIEGQA